MWFRLLHAERARFDCTTMQCGPGSDSPLFHWIGHACNAALQPKRSWLGHSSQLDRCSQLRETPPARVLPATQLGPEAKLQPSQQLLQAVVACMAQPS